MKPRIESMNKSDYFIEKEKKKKNERKKLVLATREHCSIFFVSIELLGSGSDRLFPDVGRGRRSERALSIFAPNARSIPPRFDKATRL